MSNVVIEFQTDTQSCFCLYVAYSDGDFLCVQHINKGDLVEYRLSLSHLQYIKDISSLDDLLAYSKANTNIKSYSKTNKQDTSLREETLCPCPPETSPLDEVGGGILARHTLLSESVSSDLSITGEFFLSDLVEMLEDFAPVSESVSVCECVHPWLLGDFVCSHCLSKPDNIF